MSKEERLLCIMCNYVEINPYTSPHQMYKGKPICETCIELILHGNFLKKPLGSSSVQTRIPEATDIQLTNSDTCNFHGKHVKLYCLFCKSGTCWKCVSSHKTHTLKDVSEHASSLLKQLYYLEFCLVFTGLSSQSLEEEAQAGASKVVEFYYGLAGSSYTFTIKQVPEFLNKHTRILYTLNPDLQGLSLRDAKECIENGRDSLKMNPEGESMHWFEWNANTVHFTDLLTLTRTSRRLPITIPLFSRSISIPHGQILLCGGREEYNSNGIRTTWIIHLREDLRIEKIQDMLLGRSNHCLIKHGNYVYAIAGSDHRNQFTNKCERLDLSTLNWERITSLNETRIATAGVAVPEHHALYIFGGRVNENRLSETIEKYSIVHNVWRVVRLNLSFPVSGQGTVLLPDTRAQVLLFSGQDRDGSPKKNVCIVDLDRASVEHLDDMLVAPNSVFNEAKVFNGKVYAYMFDGYGFKTMVSWDIASKKWDIVAYS